MKRQASVGMFYLYTMIIVTALIYLIGQVMKDKLIKLAHDICIKNFMDYPDYDSDIEMDVADALTVIVGNASLSDGAFESSEFYDFIKDLLG